MALIDTTCPPTGTATLPLALPAQRLVLRPPPQTIPTVGAAMPIALLAQHRAWLLGGQRDLELQDPIYPAHLRANWRPLLREARALLDGYRGRLSIHGPFHGLSLLTYNSRARQAHRDHLLRALEFGTELGASCMVIHSPFTTLGSLLMHRRSVLRTHLLGLAHAMLDEVLRRAEQARCTLVIENILDTDPRPLLDLVRSFHSPFVRMSLDTGHAHITHRLGGPTPDEWVRQAGPLLGHMHLQDSDGLWDRHWAPGHGTINWDALFAALRPLRPCPRMLIEVRNHNEDIFHGAQWFQEHNLAR